MSKGENQAKNAKANKTPSNNKGNSMSMKTAQTTRTDKNPNPKAWYINTTTVLHCKLLMGITFKLCPFVLSKMQ